MIVEASFLDVLQIGLGAALNVVACSLLFGLRGLPVLYNACIGIVSYLMVQYFADLGIFASTAIASTALSMMGQIGARVFLTPVSVFLIPSIYPLVPGTAIYRMVTSFLVGDMAQGGSYLMEALTVSTGIALGYVIAETLFSIFTSLINKFKSGKKLQKIM